MERTFEPEQALTWSQGTVTALPQPATLPAVFARWVAETPDAIAVVENDTRWSYATLDRRANHFARQLLARGLTPGGLVGLPAVRSLGFVAAALGITKAGGAYVPLDPNDPPERRAQRQADCALVIDTLLATDEDATAPAVPLTANAPAYVLYTSGSTGTPKGVIVPHQAIVRLVCQTDYLQLRPDDVFAFHSNLSFDASTLELWGPLLNGASLVITETETVLSATALAGHLQRHGITALWLTTSLFNQLAHESPTLFAGLRALIFGGEAADPASVRLILEKGCPAHLVNGYGPTESTTFAVCHQITKVADDRVPIGRPIANTQAYILDPEQKPALEGELYLGGLGLALGYLNAPELTAERFVTTPFGRLYKTGDLTRWLPDGTIEYRGRIDRQVKIRGFRIEPGEIEAALRLHAGVRQAVVTPRPAPSGEPHLAAYLIGDVTPRELREFLRDRLPAQLIPASFTSLDAFPLTPNGKLDTRALPEPHELPEEQPGFVAPQTALERTIAAAWQEILGLPAVGIDDPFFDLGGTSLLMLRLRVRLCTLLAREDLRIVTLFQHPTIRSLAHHLEMASLSAAQTMPNTTAQARAAKLHAGLAQRRLSQRR